MELGYAADFGEVYGGGEGIAPYEITYCRVGGVEYGAEQFPVASEEAPGDSALPELMVWPKPARRAVTVAFAQQRPGEAVVEVVDVLGRVVRREAAAAGVGRRAVRLDLAGLASGRYVVRLRLEGAVGTQPLTLVR